MRRADKEDQNLLLKEFKKRMRTDDADESCLKYANQAKR